MPNFQGGFVVTMQVGVTAVLTASPTDVLSHVAIRARSQGVLLATCFDEAQLEALKVGAHNACLLNP
jgi:hypothetical protein